MAKRTKKSKRKPSRPSGRPSYRRGGTRAVRRRPSGRPSYRRGGTRAVRLVEQFWDRVWDLMRAGYGTDAAVTATHEWQGLRAAELNPVRVAPADQVDLTASESGEELAPLPLETAEVPA